MVNLLVNYDIGKSAEEFDKELKVITKSNDGFHWKSLSDSCGGCAILLTFVLSAIIVIAIF